jgi:trehalose 6-phosphate phosphatase
VTQPVLSPSALPALTSFALSNVLLAFDYDGTLAPIVSSPARARLRANTRRLLQRVARTYPCIVISGRALADISRRLHGIPLWYVFGNHGSEPSIGMAPTHRTKEWIRVLRRSLPKDPALVVENKTHSLTVHYRGSRTPAATRDQIIRAAASLPDVRAVNGDHAINLLRRDALDKGGALAYAVRAFACNVAIYVGDDGTDEDAFRALPGDRLLSIKVGGSSDPTHARYHLESQDDIDVLLERLLALRGPAKARRRA